MSKGLIMLLVSVLIVLLISLIVIAICALLFGDTFLADAFGEIVEYIKMRFV